MAIESDERDGSAGASGSAGRSGSSGGGGSSGAGGSAGSGGSAGTGGSGGGEPTPTPISTVGFDPFDCTALLPGGAAALGVDAVEVWQNFEPSSETRRLESEGVPCAGAPDQAACLVALEQARTAPWDGDLGSRMVGAPGFLPERLVTTKGGEVSTIDAYDDLEAQLVPVDRLDDLRFLARYGMGNFRCEFVRKASAGYEVIGQAILSDCPITEQRQLLLVSPDGEVTMLQGDAHESSGACAGRRPAGLYAQQVASASALARHLERQAYLEGASVEAFDRLARELVELGAPRELVEQARRAREDEVRHHALLVSLGRRFDPAFACQPPEAAPVEPRPLFDFALENAVEGCVRETWGALVALHQASVATDGAVRFACERIADDETRHAELAWATHAWLSSKLSEGEQRALDEAMAQATFELLDEASADDGLGEGERARLGLPSPAEARALLGRLHETLWAKPLAA